MKLDINKFSFGQLTSNTDGKTSGSGTSGVLMCFVGVLTFMLGVVDKMWLSKTPDVMNNSIIVLTIGAGLLGYRKSRDSRTTAIDAPDPSSTVVTPDAPADSSSPAADNTVPPPPGNSAPPPPPDDSVPDVSQDESSS